MRKVVEYMANMEPAIRVRVGFCGYRDHCDNSNRLQIFDFTTSFDDFKNNVSTVSATGGGGEDTPTDVLGGLNAAVTRMTWRSSIRILLHIGDRPPHSRRFNSMHNDEFPDGDPNGLTAERILREMQLAGIHYFFGKINNLTDTMTNEFQSIIGEYPVFDFSNTLDAEGLVEKFFNVHCLALSTSITLME